VKNLDFITHKPEKFCGLIRDEWEDDQPNYHLLGVPLDISSTYRPGSRFGPDYLRRILQSENFECMSEKEVDLRKHYRIKDWGNVGIIDTNLEKSLKRVSEGVQELITFQSPFLVLGGDHSTTIGVGKGFEKSDVPFYVIYIDAHLDLYEEVKESRFSHACSLKRLSELETFEGATILGYRDYLKDQIQYAKKNDIDLCSTVSLQKQKNIFQFGYDLVQKLTTKYSYIHISVDLDVLDPSFGPGVGNPVACGLFSRELIDLIAGTFSAIPQEKNYSWDIVEYNPLFDYAEITAFFVVKMMIEALGSKVPV
jgi:agmatinase